MSRVNIVVFARVSAGNEPGRLWARWWGRERHEHGVRYWTSVENYNPGNQVRALPCEDDVWREVAKEMRRRPEQVRYPGDYLRLWVAPGERVASIVPGREDPHSDRRCRREGFHSPRIDGDDPHRAQAVTCRLCGVPLSHDLTYVGVNTAVPWMPMDPRPEGARAVFLNYPLLMDWEAYDADVLAYEEDRRTELLLSAYGGARA